MKSGWVTVGVVLAIGRVAQADESYPEALVDRPLVLHPGMTQVFVDEQFSSRTDDTFGDRNPDLVVLHAFGPVEVGVVLSRFSALHLSLATHTFPETVEVFALTGVPQADDSLHVGQGALVGQRFHLIPGRLATVTGIGVSLSEDRSRDAAGRLSWAESFAGFANARIEVQAHRRLALDAGAAVGIPLAHSAGIDPSAALAVGVSAIVILGSWEIFASGGIADVTDRQLPVLSVGGSKRFGG